MVTVASVTVLALLLSTEDKANEELRSVGIDTDNAQVREGASRGVRVFVRVFGLLCCALDPLCAHHDKQRLVCTFLKRCLRNSRYQEEQDQRHTARVDR